MTTFPCFWQHNLIKFAGSDGHGTDIVLTLENMMKRVTAQHSAIIGTGSQDSVALLSTKSDIDNKKNESQNYSTCIIIPFTQKMED